MALLFIDGFDAGDVATKWSTATSAVSSTTTRFGTGRSVQIPYGPYSPIKVFPTQMSQVFVGFAFAASNAGAVSPFFHIWGDNGATLHLTVSWDAGATIQLRRGAWNGTLIASGICTQQAWQYVEISATISSTVGNVVVRVNGTTILTFTGNTKNGGTNNSIDTVSGGLTYSSVSSNYYDDLYVCDATGPAPYNTFLGDIRINTLTPNGIGATTQFSSSSGANHTVVDELPYSATDYVTASASGTRDTYTMSDVAGNYSVLGMQNNVIAKKLDAGGTAIKPAIVSGGTVYYGTSKTLGTSDATITDTRSVNPATSTAWTLADINNLEAGMEIA